MWDSVIHVFTPSLNFLIILMILVLAMLIFVQAEQREVESREEMEREGWRENPQ